MRHRIIIRVGVRVWVVLGARVTLRSGYRVSISVQNGGCSRSGGRTYGGGYQVSCCDSHWARGQAYGYLTIISVVASARVTPK